MGSQSNRGYIYIHMNMKNHFVITSGIQFQEFLKGIPIDLANLLMVRHKFEDGHFNMRTMLDYVDAEMIPRLMEEDVYQYGDFCWLDFLDEENLNQLTGQEIAEILYLGHLKDHLKSPFYQKLNNQFVYLAGDDGWFNKTYYKNWEHFYQMLGSVIAGKINSQREINFFGRWKKRVVPPIPSEILHSFINHMKEGIVISIEKAVRNRSVVEIPVWIIGDFYDMDDAMEEFEQLTYNQKSDGKIVFDRKTAEWQAYANYSVIG